MHPSTHSPFPTHVKFSDSLLLSSPCAHVELGRGEESRETEGAGDRRGARQEVASERAEYPPFLSLSLSLSVLSLARFSWVDKVVSQSVVEAIEKVEKNQLSFQFQSGFLIPIPGILSAKAEWRCEGLLSDVMSLNSRVLNEKRRRREGVMFR